MKPVADQIRLIQERRESRQDPIFLRWSSQVEN